MKIPIVWVIQSTWLEPFFKHGAGMTDNVHPALLKKIADATVFFFINVWIRVGMLSTLNQAAKHYGVKGYETIFEYWDGDVNLVAEPAEFSNAKLPEHYHFVGPLMAQEDFPIPEQINALPHDKPLIYFAMGSSGTPEIVANIVESFAGQPYRVIAPVKSHLDKVPDAKIPDNVLVTGWLPATKVNPLVDLSVIHGGVGTVMTAAAAGKPVVGVGMQPEQDANIAALVRKGFAIRIPKSKHPGEKVQEAITSLLHDEEAKRKAAAFSEIMKQWDGREQSAAVIYDVFGK